MHAKSHQPCPTLCSPMDGSLPGSCVHRTLQARTLEWAAISFSNACKHAQSCQPCPTLQPHGQQPARLLRPWDSPGKNTGVGCRFLLQCMKVKSESEVAQLCPTLRLLHPWEFPGKVLEWGAIAFSNYSPTWCLNLKIFFLN